jgi:hypothetical protein
MTLRLAHDGNVVATELPPARESGVALNGENRRVLRSVSFLRTTHPRGT